MKTIAYGTERSYVLSTAFDTFEDIGNIRNSYFNYSNIVIINDAVENIVGIDSLMRFARALNSNVRFILIYEDKTLEAYTSLFDLSYCVRISALDSNLAEQMISGMEAKDSLLTTMMDNQDMLEIDTESINPLQGIIPTALPDDRAGLISIINKLSEVVLSTTYTTRRVIHLNTRYKEALNKLLRYKDGVVHSMNKTKKVNELLSNDNLYLRGFKEEALQANPRFRDNLVYENDSDILTIHIKDIDGFLFTQKFLELLVMKITYTLGIPTKFYILDDLSVRASHTSLTTVYDNYTSPTIYKSIGMVKVGYTPTFLNDVFDDKSLPKIVIIFNSIAGLDIRVANTLNYYAVKGNPERYPSLKDFKDYTITNYPDTTLSYAYSPNFKEMQTDKITRDYLLNTSVFDTLIEDISGAMNIIEVTKAKEKLDQVL